MKVLNVYVSSQMTSNPGMMTPGGIVVDHKGIIKERYSWEAGYGTNMLVELTGVEQGLRLSCNHQPVAITVFSANLPIIEQLRGTTSARSQNLACALKDNGASEGLNYPCSVPVGTHRWTEQMDRRFTKRARQRGCSMRNNNALFLTVSEIAQLLRIGEIVCLRTLQQQSVPSPQESVRTSGYPKRGFKTG